MNKKDKLIADFMTILEEEYKEGNVAENTSSMMNIGSELKERADRLELILLKRTHD